MKKKLISTDAYPSYIYFEKKFQNMLRGSRNIGRFVCLFYSRAPLVVITKHGISH